MREVKMNENKPHLNYLKETATLSKQSHRLKLIRKLWIFPLNVIFFAEIFIYTKILRFYLFLIVLCLWSFQAVYYYTKWQKEIKLRCQNDS